MRTGLAFCLLLLLAGCAPSREERKTPPPPAAPDANLTVTAYEVVEKPEDEGTAYLKVYVDGAAAGQTATGPRSQEKKWEGAVPAGNHPVRFEYWVMTSTSDFSRLADDHQPRERFLRVEDGMRTKVEVKFYDQARKNAVTTAKEPMGRR